MEDNSNINRSDEIDLKLTYKFILRNRKTLFLFGIAGLIFTYIFISFQKNIWKGELQIVLEDTTKSNNILNRLSRDSNLPSQIAGGLNSKKRLNTEKEILKSPSVLMPIFEFVKTEKKKKGINVDFSSWREKNLDVKFISGTSILRLNYVDNNKELVLPVLNKISTTYQKYPDRNRIKGLKNGINYLDKQLEKYKAKSKESIIRLQEFASINDMPFLIDNIKNEKRVPSLESVRIASTNKIREIDQKLVELESIFNNNKLKSFIGLLKTSSLLPEKNVDTFQNELDKLETKIINSKSRYKSTDPSLLELFNRREYLIRKIKENTIGALKMRRLNAELLKKSATRPKEILNNYRLLTIEANRDQSILSRLINNKEELSLSIAKNEKPWQLISKPELYNYPFKIDKNKNIFFGFIATLFFGFLFCFLYEKKKGLIFDSCEIKNNSNFIKKIFIILNKDEDEDEDEDEFRKLELFISNLPEDKKESIGILNLTGDSKINNNLKKVFENVKVKNYVLTTKINNIIYCNYKIFLIKVRETFSEKLYNATESILLLNNKIDVIISFEKSNL